MRRDDWWVEAWVVQKETQKGGLKVATMAEPRVAEMADLMGSLLGSPQVALWAERWAEKRAGRWGMSAARSADWLVIQKVGQKDVMWWEQRLEVALSMALTSANT